jgi:hypothetical protein
MTRTELINQATDNAHAMWVNDETVRQDYATEEEFIEAMVQNAFDDFVGLLEDF